MVCGHIFMGILNMVKDADIIIYKMPIIFKPYNITKYYWAHVLILRVIKPKKDYKIFILLMIQKLQPDIQL